MALLFGVLDPQDIQRTASRALNVKGAVAPFAQLACTLGTTNLLHVSPFPGMC